MQTFPTVPFPDNENRRLAALAEYALLDSVGVELFDSLTRLAAQACATPISLINVIDRDRQWVNSNVCYNGPPETARDFAFCGHTILSDELLEITDASLDARFADNPLVQGDPHIRFYAGVPLIVSSGDTLGTLCVLDRKPRVLSLEQRRMLGTIAATIVEQFEQRRAYTRLFDRSAAEVYEIDAMTGRLTFVSDAACRNSGFSLAELRELSLADILPELASPFTFTEFVAGLRAAHGTQPALRTTVRRKNGMSYPIDVRFELLTTANADRVLVFGIATSGETMRLAAGDAAPLELQNERLLTLAAVARDLFDALDPRALFDALVRGVSALTGGGTAQLVAPSANGELIHTRDLAARPDAFVTGDAFLRAAAAGDSVVIGEDALRAAIPILAPSGSLAYVLDIRVVDRPLLSNDAFAFRLLGQYFAVAIRNVELYGELEARRAAVVELNQVKNDLIAMLAHDFKGPLTTIVGLADVLAEDERFDGESRQFLGMINSSAMRLASLATDTLALSRLEQNELSLRFEPVDIVALLRDIVRVFSVTRGIDVRCAMDNAIVRADPARLRQVFENLIGNAIKYSPRGDMVDVTLREKRGGVEVAVRDRGIGIPAGDIPKLFGRFARGSNAREMGIGGTGFGLYLSRTIVERHGGQITIESKEGSGSTFRVLVPIVPAPQSTRDRRILLLDRERAEASFIAHTLREGGYAVYPVANEAELLRALDEGRYDAAIVDVDQLVIPSAQLVEGIARRTTLVRLAVDAEVGASRWNVVLRKPFLMKDLRAVVETAVADRRRGPRRSASER